MEIFDKSFFEDLIKIFTPVYNKYKDTDYKATSDNLNPLREIEYDVEDLRNKIYFLYKKRLEALLGKPSPISSTTPESYETILTPDLMNILMKGLTDKPKQNIEIPNPPETFPSRIGLNNLSEQGNRPAGADLKDLLVELGELIQDDLVTGFLKGPFVNFCENLPSSPSLSAIEDFFLKEGEEKFTTTEPEKDNSKRSQVAAALTKRFNSPPPPGFVDCIKIQLYIIAIILALLSIVKLFSMIESYVLSIYTLIVKLVKMVCEVWINPSTINVILAKMSSIAISIIIAILGFLIMFLIKLLNIDCVTNATLDIAEEMIGAFKAVKIPLEEIPKSFKFGQDMKEVTVDLQDYFKKDEAMENKDFAKSETAKRPGFSIKSLIQGKKPSAKDMLKDFANSAGFFFDLKSDGNFVLKGISDSPLGPVIENVLKNVDVLKQSEESIKKTIEELQKKVEEFEKVRKEMEEKRKLFEAMNKPQQSVRPDTQKVIEEVRKTWAYS